jgi:hypothetical protein
VSRGTGRSGRVRAGVLLAALATIAAAATLPTHALADADGGATASFQVGAAVESFTPPIRPPVGSVPGDPADCAPDPVLRSTYNGPRHFFFEEPYVDLEHSGHYDGPDPSSGFPGDPFIDCNHNGRWDGNLLGGGSAPRFYTKVADEVGARAVVLSNGRRTIAVEVTDQEGLFNVYQQRIRERVADDGFHLDGIFISATHDESAPDTLGLGGVNPLTSGVNAYFVDYLVAQSAKAIEDAYLKLRPATIGYAEALEPANLRQCWSSYPYVDDQLMPVLQAVDSGGHVIVTLTSVSQHAETLAFNPDPAQKTWISSDWPYFFRSALEHEYGGVGIEMAGSVGSVETPEVFSGPISGTPQQFIDASHPAGCRTLFDANGTQTPTGYYQETQALGQGLAGAVAQALASATPSRSTQISGARRDVCLPLSNKLFLAAAAAGVFAQRPAYTANCTVQSPIAPNGSTTGTEVLTQVGAFQIGDGQFLSLPGEVFPFTYLRGFQGPQDMPFPQYGLPPWLVPHMRAPWRFVDGLAEDMLGYIFPRGNGVGVPGENPTGNPTADSTDRFGCAHSDDSESANSQAGDILGASEAKLLDSLNKRPEPIEQGRYVMPNGSLSRDPLGSPEIKCNVDTVFHAPGPAVAVWLLQHRVVKPASWMSLSGRPQSAPDRNTRGYIAGDGSRHWLEVFDDVAAPATVTPPG